MIIVTKGGRRLKVKRLKPSALLSLMQLQNEGLFLACRLMAFEEEGTSPVALDLQDVDREASLTARNAYPSLLNIPVMQEGDDSDDG